MRRRIPPSLPTGNKLDPIKVERIKLNFGGMMAEAKSVPVLFVSDPIVLPGMVVPIALDDAARAAVMRSVTMGVCASRSCHP